MAPQATTELMMTATSTRKVTGRRKRERRRTPRTSWRTKTKNRGITLAHTTTAARGRADGKERRNPRDSRRLKFQRSVFFLRALFVLECLQFVVALFKSREGILRLGAERSIGVSMRALFGLNFFAVCCSSLTSSEDSTVHRPVLLALTLSEYSEGEGVGSGSVVLAHLPPSLPFSAVVSRQCCSRPSAPLFAVHHA